MELPTELQQRDKKIGATGKAVEKKITCRFWQLSQTQEVGDSEEQYLDLPPSQSRDCSCVPPGPPGVGHKHSLFVN